LITIPCALHQLI